jgi:hypothetical protein
MTTCKRTCREATVLLCAIPCATPVKPDLDRSYVLCGLHIFFKRKILKEENSFFCFFLLSDSRCSHKTNRTLTTELAPRKDGCVCECVFTLLHEDCSGRSGSNMALCIQQRMCACVHVCVRTKPPRVTTSVCDTGNTCCQALCLAAQTSRSPTGQRVYAPHRRSGAEPLLRPCRSRNTMCASIPPD